MIALVALSSVRTQPGDRQTKGPGFEPTIATAIGWHGVPAMNWVLSGILDRVTHEEAPDRNPIKATGH